jgi:hypothetical protein
VDQLRQRVDYLWLAFEAADYEVLGRALPAVLRDSQRSHTALREAASAQVLAETYQITASTARKLGDFDLAWIAGDQGLAVAEEAADQLLTATGAYRVANALLAMGRVDAAYALNVSIASRLEPSLQTPADRSVYGTMLLQAAIASARRGDNRESRDLIREAHEVGERVGPAASWRCRSPTARRPPTRHDLAPVRRTLRVCGQALWSCGLNSSQSAIPTSASRPSRRLSGAKNTAWSCDLR